MQRAPWGLILGQIHVFGNRWGDKASDRDGNMVAWCFCFVCELVPRGRYGEARGVHTVD